MKTQADIKQLIRSGTVNGTAKDLVTQGVDKNPAKGKDEIQQGVERAIAYIDSHECGQIVKAGLLRKQMKVTRTNEAAIMNVLTKKGGHLVKGENGNRPEYTKPKSIEKPAEIASEPSKKARVFNIFGR